MRQTAFDKKFWDRSLERDLSWKKYKRMIETEETPGGGGKGGTPLYKLYRYLPPHRVGFFTPFWSENTLPILVWNPVWFSRELRRL